MTANFVHLVLCSSLAMFAHFTKCWNPPALSDGVGRPSSIKATGCGLAIHYSLLRWSSAALSLGCTKKICLLHRQEKKLPELPLLPFRNG